MGWDYAFVHLKYNLPPALVLTFLYRPLISITDIYKLLFLIAIAVVSTIPWDSYLIRQHIWSYPEDAVVGWTLDRVPLEEVFFFVIQTYNTTFIYLILSRPVFQYAYLPTNQHRTREHGKSTYIKSKVGQAVLVGAILSGVYMLNSGGKCLYIGLILSWAGPFILLLWSLTYEFILNLPITTTLLPICLPTFYLWIVDTFALKRGTWVIDAETKSDLYLWNDLELEEAIFFFVTNMMIAFGLLAFDNALAILYSFPALYENVRGLPTPTCLVKALLLPTAYYDSDRIRAFNDAIRCLQMKSRSFYLASAGFQGRLRIDLVLVYSYCRVADDLIDNATSVEEANSRIQDLYQHLEYAFSEKQEFEVEEMIKHRFPLDVQSALIHLPFLHLSKRPLYGLLKGFEMDLAFFKQKGNPMQLPIKTEADLETYCSFVAGTVAELCLDLVYYHYPESGDFSRIAEVKRAGHDMGTALQLINIARDISVDSSLGRVYLPSTWLDEYGLTFEDVLQTPSDYRVERLRSRLLDKAFKVYHKNIDAIEKLPKEVRGPMRAAVESYIEIGQVLRDGKGQIKQGKASVPIMRRIRVAWKAMNRPLQRE